jgi:hypothetical protein
VTTPQYPFGEQPSDDDPFRQQDTFGSGSYQDDSPPQDPYDPFARASRPAEQPAYYPPPPAGYGPPTAQMPGPPPQGPPRHTARNVLLSVVGAVVLVGIIAGVAVALSSGGSTGKPAAGTSRAATSATSAAATPSAGPGTLGCAAQLAVWQAGAGGHSFAKVAADASALDTEMGNGSSGAGSSAATTLGAEARQAAAHPMPSCADPADAYAKAMAQWSLAATDAAAGNLSGELTAFGQATTYFSTMTNEMNHVSAGA